MKKAAGLLITLLLTGCGGEQKHKTERLKIDEQTKGKTSVVVLGAELTREFQQEVQKAGIKLEGQNILRLTGTASELNQLNIPVKDSLEYTIDTELEVSHDEVGKIDNETLYLAKKEFGIIDFWKSHPEADGRGVIVGVIDDGISPHQVGFQRTTTGARKFLAKTSQSTFSTFPLTDAENGFTVEVKEGMTFGGKLDLNMDGTINNWKASVSADGSQVCLDLNVDEKFDETECKGTFAKSGDYYVLPEKATLAVMTEVDLSKKTLRVLQPEKDDDSHGEGVATVMAGHNSTGGANLDGVAPGAQIVDYDLSELTNKPVENEYTIGTFLLAIDWLGSQGAEVANVSYSLFFTNTATQTFMSKALAAIIEKHNMVVSFSAGNNGPGLGSLNRRLIYPSSALVAGAYVPKELDERVWGVTGLPEEGRVVYYSSRGPGAGAAGPTVISPLSSLTHSSPNEGYRAFNGTSSASPALAGAATVLISAIKQAGLKVNAATVVAALRLSGKRIADEPYVSQGFGLPQIPKALEIYKSLIKGEKFQNVSASVSRGGLDGTTAQGIFLRTSQVNSVETYRVTFTGELSALAPADATINLLTPVDIEYTKGITGPKELWVSVSQSRIAVDVNADEMLGDANEGFGEIRLYSKTNRTLLAVVPITAVRDQRVGTFLRQNLTIGSQEGARIHLNVPEGVKGIRVRARVVEGEASLLNFGTFTPDYIRAEQNPLTREFIMATPKAGHYQVTMIMNGGTSRKATVEFEMEELNIKLNTEVTSAEGGKIHLSNFAQTAVQGDLVLIREVSPLKTQIFNNKNDIPEITMNVAKGHYGVELLPTAQYDMSYLYANCSIMVQNENGEYEATEDPTYKNETDKEVTLKFRCAPFDLGIAANENLFWKLQISTIVEEEKVIFDLAGRAKKEFTLPKLVPGIYRVEYSTIFEKKRISLGKIEVI